MTSAVEEAPGLLSQKLTSRFFPGEHTLFDRAKEQERLIRAYKEEKHAFVLISGHSGTGKTALAYSLRDYMASTRRANCKASAYFIAGKFDQVERQNEPYQAIGAAWAEWVDQVLQEQNYEVKRIQSACHTPGVLDRKDLLLLMTIVPSLERLLDKPPPPPSSTSLYSEEPSTSFFGDGASAPFIANGGGGGGGTENSSTARNNTNRFKRAMQSFVRAVANTQHPIVMLLDDLQWADAASLDILYTLAADSTMAGFLLLGTCRDNEVPAATHPLAATLRSLEDEADTRLVHISLRNHSQVAVAQLVSEWMDLPESTAQFLADRVYSVTAGNMLFILHFLQFLYDAGLLYKRVDADGAEKWQWDDDKLKSEQFAGNVVDFVVRKMQRLPLTCQNALTALAGTGVELEESILQLLLDENPREVFEPALQEGFLEYNSDEKLYRFVHDRIQEAAYSLLAEEERNDFHLKLGRRLWKRAKKTDLKTKVLFVIVGQMNSGTRRLVDNPREQYDLAALNLRAAKRVVSASAFGAGAAYLQKSLELLEGKNHWYDEYELCLDLFNVAAEVEYCLGNFQSTENLVLEVIRHATTFHDQLRAYATLVYLRGAQNRMEEAMSIGLDTLKRLGQSFPKKVTFVNIFVDLMRTKLLLRKRRTSDLLRLPLLKDPEKIAAMQLMNLMLMYAYFVRPELMPFLAFRMVHLTIRSGLCAIASVGFTTYGLVLLGALGEIEEGHRYGRLGLTICDNFESKEWIPRLHLLFYGLLDHWINPLSEGLTPLVEAYRLGLVTGDIEYAMMDANMSCMYALQLGLPLEPLESEMRNYCAEMETYGQNTALFMTIPTLQTVLNLRGQAVDPCLLTGEMMDSEKFLKSAKEAKNTAQLCSIYSLQLSLAVLFGEFQFAMDMAEKSSNVEEELMCLYDVVAYHINVGLVAASMAQRTGRRKYRARVRRHLNKIRKWAKYSPTNNLHKKLLLEAEVAALERNVELASRLFRESIEEARISGFVNMQAIANERAALCLHNYGDKATAESFYEEANALYRSWGALAKVDRLIYQY